MRRRQRVRNLHRDVQQVLKVQRLAMNALLQALALEFLHDNDTALNIRLTHEFVVNLVDGADVWMVEL